MDTEALVDEASKIKDCATDERITRLGVLRWVPIAVATIVAVMLAALIMMRAASSPQIEARTPIGQTPRPIPQPDNVNGPHLLHATFPPKGVALKPGPGSREL